MRRLLFHPLAAPILLALLFADLWVAVPPNGIGGGSTMRAMYLGSPKGTVLGPLSATALLRAAPAADSRCEWKFFTSPIWSSGPPPYAEIGITYWPDETAAGTWAITRIRSRHLITIDDLKGSSVAHFNAALLTAAREQFIDQVVAPTMRLSPVILAQLKTGDLSEDHILYAGYLHNTAALFMAAWLPFALYGLYRFAANFTPNSRRRRGLCPACAYPLAGLPPETPCPECGTTRTLPPCAAASSTP